MSLSSKAFLLYQFASEDLSLYLLLLFEIAFIFYFSLFLLLQVLLDTWHLPLPGSCLGFSILIGLSANPRLGCNPGRGVQNREYLSLNQQLRVKRSGSFHALLQGVRTKTIGSSVAPSCSQQALSKAEKTCLLPLCNIGDSETP